MEFIQEYAIRSIHASPAEDLQFRFGLIRVTQTNRPVMSSISLYQSETIPLPDTKSFFHVYILGGNTPATLNMIASTSDCMCKRTRWVNVEEDMNSRAVIMQLYNDKGIIFPRRNTYYRVVGDNALAIAFKIDDIAKENFDYESIRYLRVFTGRYPSQKKTRIFSRHLEMEYDIVNFQRELDEKDLKLEDFFVYLNGYMTNIIDLTTPLGSFVELIYSPMAISLGEYRIGDLRVFNSIKDKVTKYFIFKPERCVREPDDGLECFKDDLEIYIFAKDEKGKKVGLYYYQNRDESIRNLTPFDFSMHATYVNNQAKLVAKMTNSRFQDVTIRMWLRPTLTGEDNHTVRRRPKFNGLSLTELFKLPPNVQYDVMCNNNIGIEEWRVETLENHDYFVVEGTERLSDITPLVSARAVGYFPMGYYFGQFPKKVVEKNMNMLVPPVYRRLATAYEYDENGILINHYPTHSTYYPVENENAGMVEFIQGRSTNRFRLYEYAETAEIDPLKEYRILTAVFKDNDRITEWTDITHEPHVIFSDKRDKVTVSIEGRKGIFRVVCLDEPYMMDVIVDISREFPLITLSSTEIFKGIESQRNLDYYPDTLEIFMNGHRLIEGIDFFMEFPYVRICNKDYLVPNAKKVHLHIRGLGFVETPEGINAREVRGYINHGVLQRNGNYDVIDSKVYSLFVKGRMFDPRFFAFAEEHADEDMGNIYNGLPYVLCDHYTSMKSITGLETWDFFKTDLKKNEHITGLFNMIYPEKTVDKINVIRSHHYLFSPTTSRVIDDLHSGKIPPSTYTKRYTELDVRNVMKENGYDEILKLDPVRFDLPKNITEIHPHYTFNLISMNIFQYRFLENVVRVITKGDVNRINLSGYIRVNHQSDLVDPETVDDPSGSLV